MALGSLVDGLGGASMLSNALCGTWCDNWRKTVANDDSVGPRLANDDSECSIGIGALLLRGNHISRPTSDATGTVNPHNNNDHGPVPLIPQ